MSIVTRFALVTALLFAPAPVLFAQPAGDPSGHWTGAIHVPAFNGDSPREVAIEIDLASNAGGKLAGTFGQPAQNVKGLPLSSVSLKGKAVSF